MIQHAIYFNQSFTLRKFGMLLGLATPHHNIDIAKDWLIQLEILEESDNSIGMKVYGIVEMIRLHIRYEKDNGIENQLTQLLLEGNTTIKARKIKTNTSKGKRKI